MRRDQKDRFESHFIGADLANPDFMKIADAFGAEGYLVTSPKELKLVLSKAIDQDRPTIIEVEIEEYSESNPWKYIMG